MQQKKFEIFLRHCIGIGVSFDQVVHVIVTKLLAVDELEVTNEYEVTNVDVMGNLEVKVKWTKRLQILPAWLIKI